MNKPKKAGLADLKRLTQQHSQAQPDATPAVSPEARAQLRPARYHPADPRRPGGPLQGQTLAAGGRPAGAVQPGLSPQAVRAIAQSGAGAQASHAKPRPVAESSKQLKPAQVGTRRSKSARAGQGQRHPDAVSSHAHPSHPDGASTYPGPGQAQATAASQSPEASLLSAADRALFRRVMQAVQPLKDPSPRVSLGPKAPSAWEVQQRRLAAVGAEPTVLAQVSDGYAASAISADGKQYVQSGHGAGVLKDLQKNRWPIEAWLDLHGSTLDDARTRLEQFLQLAMQAGVRCVSVVHGKGHGSSNGQPVLKEPVRRWLGQFAGVVAYVECAENEGGAGAVKVLLKKGEAD